MIAKRAGLWLVALLLLLSGFTCDGPSAGGPHPEPPGDDERDFGQPDDGIGGVGAAPTGQAPEDMGTPSGTGAQGGVDPAQSPNAPGFNSGNAGDPDAVVDEDAGVDSADGG